MERKHSIDLLRIISAAAIVLIHIVSTPVANGPADLDPSLWRNLQLIHVAMNWAVPVFFMITGYCLLRKPALTYGYIFRHIRKYVCVLFTVGPAFALMERVFQTGTIHFSVIFQSFLDVIRGDLWDHMWFVYAIMSIYLVMPVIHLFMDRDPRGGIALTALLFVFNILLPAFEGVLPVAVKLPFDGYLFYVCLGGILAKRKFGRTWSLAICLAGLLGLGWIILGWDRWDFGYCHPAVCAMAVSIFLGVTGLEIKGSKQLLGLSACTWGVYLIHPLLINVVVKVLNIDMLGGFAYGKLLVFWMTVLAASFGITWVLRRIPWLKKLF